MQVRITSLHEEIAGSLSNLHVLYHFNECKCLNCLLSTTDAEQNKEEKGYQSH